MDGPLSIIVEGLGPWTPPEPLRIDAHASSGENSLSNRTVKAEEYRQRRLV